MYYGPKVPLENMPLRQKMLKIRESEIIALIDEVSTYND